MKKIAMIVALAAACLSVTGCTDAIKADIMSLGNDHLVEMYSGGVMIRSWTSSGYVESSTESDGYYFNDKDSGILIKVSGDVVITTLD